MSNDKTNSCTGRYARPDDAQTIRDREAERDRFLREEQAKAFARRKRRVALGACLVLVAGMLLAMIHNGLIDQLIGEVFLTAAAAWFGYQIGK